MKLTLRDVAEDAWQGILEAASEVVDFLREFWVFVLLAMAAMLAARCVPPAHAAPNGTPQVIHQSVTPDGQRLVELADYDRPRVFELWETWLVPPAPRRRVGPRVDGLRDVSAYAVAPDSSRVVWKEQNTALGGSLLRSSAWSAAASGLSSGLAEVGAPAVSCDSRWVSFLGSEIAGVALTPRCVAITGGTPTRGYCPRVPCPIFLDGFEGGSVGAWR